jgi:hypothetical protein
LPGSTIRTCMLREVSSIIDLWAWSGRADLFSMTDDQLQALCELAEPLPPEWRSELSRLTAVELAGVEPSDAGSLARAARIALAKVFQAERLIGLAKVLETERPAR